MKFNESFEDNPTDFSALSKILSVLALKTNLSELIITWGLVYWEGIFGGVLYEL